MLNTKQTFDNPLCNKKVQCGLQKLEVWATIQFDCSDPLYTMNDCKKSSETTEGKRTQWKPVVFAVELFAV